MGEWMAIDLVSRELVVEQKLENLRAEAARERLARESRVREADEDETRLHPQGGSGVRVRLGMALVRAGVALGGQHAAA